MNRIVRTALLVSITAVALLFNPGTASSHCEIPCGIYGDTTRIALLYEDIDTVEKSMKQVSRLSDGSNHNQLVRWINNKDSHANKIQHIVTQYFMTQRVKPKGKDDAEAHAKYVSQLTTLHGMLIHAMKSKQTVDPQHCEKLRHLVDAFSESYFSKEDLEHIRKAHGSHKKGK